MGRRHPSQHQPRDHRPHQQPRGAAVVRRAGTGARRADLDPRAAQHGRPAAPTGVGHSLPSGHEPLQRQVGADRSDHQRKRARLFLDEELLGHRSASLHAYCRGNPPRYTRPLMNPDSVQSEGLDAIAAAPDTAALEQVRIALLGRKAPLVLALRELGSLAPEERGPRGKVLNQVRQSLEAALDARESELEAAELDDRLRRDLIEQTGREILEVLVGLGYRISDGPEVETVYRNFDALNHAPTHPTRQPRT